MGPPTSASRDAIFDAAERVLRRDGHTGLSARSVAEEAGFNHQTIYYYFQTMEDLVLATFRRRCERSLGQLERALSAEEPLRAIWQIYSDPANGRLNVEFNALAMQNEALRAEVKRYLEQSRAMQEEALAPLLARGSFPDVVAPTVPGMLILFVANFLDREAALGVTTGHPEMARFVDWCLRHFELKASGA